MRRLSRSSVLFTRPPRSISLTVSAGRRPGTAAPCRLAASMTLETTSRGTIGLAASCMRTMSQAPGPIAASPRSTLSCRRAPPATTAITLGCRRISAAAPRRRPRGTTATIASIPGCAANRWSACSSRVRPPTLRNCFGTVPPTRVPLPAAATIATTLVAPRRFRLLRPDAGLVMPLWPFRLSNFEQLFFLVLHELVDRLDVPVGELLNLLERSLFVIFGESLLLQHLLRALIGL